MLEQQLNWQKYLLLVRYHWRFLLLCAVGGLLVGTVLNAWIMPPTYSSEAKLLIKGAKTPSYVTTLESGNPENQALTINGNPLLTQIEVINSVQLAKRVLWEIQQSLTEKKYQNYSQKYVTFFQPEALAEKLKLKNPANTDIITLELSSPDKNFTKLVANQYIRSYKGFLQSLNKQSLSQRGVYLEEQITATERKLEKVRQQLMVFRQANQTIDLPNEAQATIQQIADLDTQRIALASQISARRGGIRNLQKILGMTSGQGIQSVALGMNTALGDLQKSMDTAMQEYRTLSVKYTDANPTLVALRSKIEEIQHQLQDETGRTLGVVAPAKASAPMTPHIADPVRSNLVNNLANAETELTSLVSQENAMASDIAQLKSMTPDYANKQLHLSELLDSEKVLSEMVNMLRLKAAEAQFQASDSLSNVVVVQSASLPLRADFPRPIHILAMMMMFGVLGGMSWLLSLEWLKMRTMLPLQEEMDKATVSRSQEYTPY